MISGMTTGEGDAWGRGLSPEDLDGVDPVTAVMLADACRAIAAYPELVAVGALFTAAERVPGGWQIVCEGDPLPQGARELLADHLEDSGDEPLAEAGRWLRTHPADEVTAAGRRFRVVRVEQLVRTGPEGPEPPRPTDVDPRPGDHRLPRRRPYDLLRDGQSIPDLAGAELLCQLLDATGRTGAEPTGSFLTPAQLAPAFTVAERSHDGRWRPVGRLHDTPQQARDSLATYFRHVVPAVESPNEADLAAYQAAASLMTDATRRNGIAVAGRRFRIVRLERLTLMGPDGPEPPRPTDVDVR